MVFDLEHGKYTAELGRRLKARAKSAGKEDLGVYFDHGAAGESQRVVPYFDVYDLSTTLAFVDIAVVNERTKSIIVLCEVEEEGANPKKVIGDCYNIFISDSVCIGRIPYDLSKARLLLGIKIPDKGDSGRKVRKILARIQTTVREDRLKGITIELTCESDYRTLVDRLEGSICELVGI